MHYSYLGNGVPKQCISPKRVACFVARFAICRLIKFFLNFDCMLSIAQVRHLHEIDTVQSKQKLKKKLNSPKFGETRCSYMGSFSIQPPLLLGTERGYLVTTLTWYSPTWYQVFCSTWYRVLLFSSSQAPTSKYLLGCRTLLPTYLFFCHRAV